MALPLPHYKKCIFIQGMKNCWICPIPSNLLFSEYGEQVSYLNHLLKLCPSNVKAQGSFLVNKKMIFTQKYINRYVNIYTFFTQ